MKPGAARIKVLRASYGRLALVLALGAALILGGCATAGGGRPAPLTVDQVIQMSKAGTPPPQIIKQMADSGTAYRLSASQLSALKSQGVSDEVIDYMQQTYLEAVRRDQSRQDLRYWHWGPDSFFYGGVPYGW